jgi:hypothetical protein
MIDEVTAKINIENKIESAPMQNRREAIAIKNFSPSLYLRRPEIDA